MGFSDDVAEILTMLTTKDGGLPQGAVTSSFLANLVFWDYEPSLVEKLAIRGLRYFRYVDDVCVSSMQRLQVKDQSRLVGEIYVMLLHHGFKPKRSKHEVFTAGKSMRTTKLLNNKRVALPVEQRQNVRAAVYELEKLVASGDHGTHLQKELARVASSAPAKQHRVAIHANNFRGHGQNTPLVCLNSGQFHAATNRPDTAYRQSADQVTLSTRVV